MKPDPLEKSVDILSALKKALAVRDAERKAESVDRQQAGSGLDVAEQNKKESQ